MPHVSTHLGQLLIYGGRCEARQLIPASLERGQGYKPDVETLFGDRQIKYYTVLFQITASDPFENTNSDNKRIQQRYTVLFCSIYSTEVFSFSLNILKTNSCSVIPVDVPQDPAVRMHLQSNDGKTVLSQHLHIRRMEDSYPAQSSCTHL